MPDPLIPVTPPPAAPTTPTVTPVVEPHTKASISDAEAAQIARDIREDVAKGKITQTVADARFAELNTPLEQRAPDSRTDEQKQLDAQFPPAKESDYLIRYYTPGQEPPVISKELKAFDASARTWLSGAEFPRDLGNSLVSTIEKVAQQTKAMTPDQLESYGYAEYAKLEKTYGSELENKLQAAGRMVEALDAKQPGLKNLLKSKGIGDNALVASLLIQQAERYHRRKGT